MKCPICGRTYPDNHIFCSECGCTLIKPKKGRLWPPILVLVLMFTLGTAVYFLTKDHLPTLSNTPWFTMDEGALHFDESLYTGTPELEIPASIDKEPVIAIGRRGFYNCDSLTTVILPDSLESVSEYAFEDCDRLRGIKLPEGMHTIGTGAFSGCEALEAIYIPSSVRVISADVFDGCSSLRHIFYGGTAEDWMALCPEEIGPNVQIHIVSDFN